MLLLALKRGEDSDDLLSEVPEDVYHTARLQSDLESLLLLLEGTELTRIPCRLQKLGWICYRIGDASGDGFGAAIHVGNHLKFRYS